MPDPTPTQKQKLAEVMKAYPSIFNANPGKTTVSERYIHVADSAPHMSETVSFAIVMEESCQALNSEDVRSQSYPSILQALGLPNCIGGLNISSLCGLSKTEQCDKICHIPYATN